MSIFWPRDGIHFPKNEDVQIDGRHVLSPKSVENVILHILNTNKKVRKNRRHFLKNQLFNAFDKDKDQDQDHLKFWPKIKFRRSISDVTQIKP